MIDTVLNLLFRCPHRHLTRPVTLAGKAGVPHGATYVGCLDCGKQFAYDLERMRIGKAIEPSPVEGLLHPDPARTPHHKKLKFALWASLPLALAIGSALKPKKQPPGAAHDKE